MSLYDKISEARGAGYSDDEILEGLRKKYPVMGGKIDTAIAEQYNPTEIVDFLSKREAPGTPEAKAPAGASYDAFTGTFTPETKENADPLKAGTALLAGIKRLPQEIGATLIQTAKGQSGATVTDKGILDRFLDENERAREEFVKQYGSEAQILPGMPISVKDVAELPSNLAFSVTSAGAGLGAGGAALFATKNPTVAWGTGMAASGAAAYRMASNQIMQQYLDAMNETAREQFGRDITPEEEAKLKNKFSNLATAYGLWEAIPEAIGNVAELKVLLKPLSKMVGQNVASKIIKKIAGTYGTELGTETITKTGQQQVESQMGLTDEAPRSFASPSDWAKSASEVAPQVFLLTTVMGGTIGGANLAYRKYTSKKLSQTVQDITGKDMTSLQDEEVDNLLANAKELKKKRSFDKKLDDSIEKIEAEAERRKTAAPVVEGEAEEVTPEVSTMPPLPQDFFDQMRGYVVAGKDSKGRPF
ncbi:MAG: hypothetical protein LLG93_01065, partial [Deltaproteobacteria bacterium]|nr:hypothetical protein [Deltaproteobacteria bacterium]